MWKKYNTLSIETKASLWAFVASIVQKGVTILATPIFTRILTTDEYAQYGLYQLWHDLLIIVSSLCVYNYATYTAMLKFDKDREGFITSAQTLVTSLSLFCFAIYIILYLIFGELTGFPLYIMVLMFIDIICLSAFNLWKAKERCLFHYRLMTVLSLIIGICGPIIGILAVKMTNYSGYGRIYGIILVNVLVGLGIYLYNIHLSKRFFVKKYWRYIFTYCIPLIPHFFASQILSRIDRIMINDMCGASQTGIYTLAFSLSMLMLFVNDAIFTSLTPWTYQKIKENKQDEIKKVANLVVILVAMCNLILVLFAPEAVKVFAPQEYYEAIYIIPAVSTSVFFIFLFNLFANIEYYYAKTKLVAIASISAAIVKVVLNYIFIDIYGYMAAGYTTMISYMLFAIGHFILMRCVSKECAKGYQFYDNKSILIISSIFVVISLMIIPLYDFMIIRYCFILLIVILIMINRKRFFKYRNICK